MPPGAKEYDGPPRIPLDELRRDLPAGWTAERAWHYGADELGHIRVMPITIVKSPDSDHLQLPSDPAPRWQRSGRLGGTHAHPRYRRG